MLGRREGGSHAYAGRASSREGVENLFSFKFDRFGELRLECQQAGSPAKHKHKHRKIHHMKTSQLERITAKFKISARRARMPIYSWFSADDAAALVTEKSVSYWGTRLREHREYARQCTGEAKSPPKSRLIWSESLRTLVEEIADGGCPVAEALLKARRFRHAHARKLAGNHFSFREKAGMISYLPAGRALVTTEAGLWARDGRQEMKPVKWARSVLAGWQLSRLRDEQFSAFAARFAAAENASALRVGLIEDVGAVYDERNYNTDTLCSCMQQCNASYGVESDNGKGQRVGDFYERAGAQVLTVRRGDGRLEGRAIYWPKIQGLGADVAGLDRVYGSPEVVELVKSWARENGVAMRSNPQGGGDTAWLLNGESLGRGAYVVPARDLCGARFFPYLDTFRFQDEDGNLWTEDDSDRTVFEYTSTQGGREERNRHEGEVQLHDGTWHDEDDAYYVESEGEYYASEDVVHCYRSDSYILREGAFEVEIGRNNTIYLSAEYVNEL